jgi:demethylmenaquinone methyltransferase/2-methoxy-6-polyprenyl-1,4-benzoquinol methylase
MSAPHPPLTGHYARDEDRHDFVMRLFERGAPHYDRMNAWLSLGFGRLYRRFVLQRSGLRPGLTVLDVATGTGLVARAALDITRDPASVIGLDPCAAMLAEARRTLPIRLVLGLAERLPFGDGRFDLVTMGYALRHVPDLDVAFAEYRRVLKPGGRVVLLEIVRPPDGVTARLLRWCLGTAMPLAVRIGTRSADAERLMRYYWDTIAACVPPETIVAALTRAGFAAARRRTYGPVLSEYEGVKPGAS